jgi:hypothetical protein
MIKTIGKKRQRKKLNFSEFDLYRVEMDILYWGAFHLVSSDGYSIESIIKIDKSNLSPNDVQIVISSDFRYAYRDGSVDNNVKIKVYIRSTDFTVGNKDIIGKEARESISCEDPDIASTKINVFTKLNDTIIDYPRLFLNATILNRPTLNIQCIEEGKMYSDILIRRNIITNIREEEGVKITKINN